MQDQVISNFPPPPVEKNSWPWSQDRNLVSGENYGIALPKVSIITPSLNQGKFIEETIRSVLLQSYPNLEYIVIDGASRDNTIDIIRKYSPWIKYWVSEPDHRQADAINKGFKKASGDILAWLNSDDTYNPDAIWNVVRLFAEHPGIKILYGEAWQIDENSHRIGPCRHIRNSIFTRYLLNLDPIVQPSAFWRHELYSQIGELDNNLQWGFDWEFFIRAHQEVELSYLPEFLANIRIHVQQKTSMGGRAIP